ncbi:Pyruvate kinase isozyme G, chloroplastic [Glycine soja]|nr:Pyruvate kinase isozyme G, chloroplastic [Glycine soja]
MGEMFAFHATTTSNTLNTPIIVFTRTGSMAILLSHYRPYTTIFAFTNEARIKQRLVLYHGVMPIYMQFSNDAEETFSRALKLLLRSYTEFFACPHCLRMAFGLPLPVRNFFG